MFCEVMVKVFMLVVGTLLIFGACGSLIGLWKLVALFGKERR